MRQGESFAEYRKRRSEKEARPLSQKTVAKRAAQEEEARRKAEEEARQAKDAAERAVIIRSTPCLWYRAVKEAERAAAARLAEAKQPGDWWDRHGKEWKSDPPAEDDVAAAMAAAFAMAVAAAMPAEAIMAAMAKAAKWFWNPPPVTVQP